MSGGAKPRLVFDPNVPRTSAGVYSLECLRERCVIDTMSGCWVWAQSMFISPKGHRNPAVWVAAGVLGPRRRSLTAQRVAYAMAHGSLLVHHRVWRTCCNDACIAPAHLKAGTTQAWGAWTAERGIWRGQASRRAGTARAAEARPRTTPLPVVRAVEQLLREGRHIQDVAQQVGIHRQTVRLIARGRHLHQRGAATNAWVFSWRPDAAAA